MFFSYIKILLENGIFLPLKLYDINPPLLRCLKKRIHASNIVHAILRSIYISEHIAGRKNLMNLCRLDLEILFTKILMFL